MHDRQGNVDVDALEAAVHELEEAARMRSHARHERHGGDVMALPRSRDISGVTRVAQPLPLAGDANEHQVKAAVKRLDDVIGRLAGDVVLRRDASEDDCDLCLGHALLPYSAT